MSIRNLALLAVLASLTESAPSLAQDANTQPANKLLQPSKPADFNTDIYYKNKLEFSLETGWLPINIPWPFDFLLCDAYNETPLKYTLVSVLDYSRWVDADLRGP